MSRFEIAERDGREWVVVDRTTNDVVQAPSKRSLGRLEAQALADFKNGMAKPHQERIRSRLDAMRLAWRAVLGNF
jgi:hypothetical protein